LAVGKIAAQDREPSVSKRLGKGAQQRSFGIRSGAVYEGEAVSVGAGGPVQVAPHWGLDGAIKKSFRGVRHKTQRLGPDT